MGKFDFDIDNVQPLGINPRYISKFDYNNLRKYMNEFGDLSGIVINVDGTIIGGHQRDKVINIKSSQIQWVLELTEPNEVGTIKVGYVEYKGKMFNIRVVDWDKDKILRANVIANKVGGSFDYDILLNEFPEELLLDSGFTEEELSGYIEEAEEALEEFDGGMYEEELTGDSITIFFKDDAEKSCMLVDIVRLCDDNNLKYKEN